MHYLESSPPAGRRTVPSSTVASCAPLPPGRPAWNTLETLGDQLTQAKVDQTVTATIAEICRADIIVIDDIGDLPIDSTQAEAFYRIIDCAHERRSIILTSNTRPDEFDTLMPMSMATAAVDRLMHHAHLM